MRAKSNSSTIVSYERKATNNDNSGANHLCFVVGLSKGDEDTKNKARRPGEKHVRTAGENKLPQRDMHLVLKIFTVVTPFFEMVRPSDLPLVQRRDLLSCGQNLSSICRGAGAPHIALSLWGRQFGTIVEGSGAKPSVFGFHDNVKLFGSRMSGQ
jgi:hypothetical protein